MIQIASFNLENKDTRPSDYRSKAVVKRKYRWGGHNTKLDKWATYPEMTEAAHQPSDQSCVGEVKMD